MTIRRKIRNRPIMDAETVEILDEAVEIVESKKPKKAKKSAKK